MRFALNFELMAAKLRHLFQHRDRFIRDFGANAVAGRN